MSTNRFARLIAVSALTCVGVAIPSAVASANSGAQHYDATGLTIMYGSFPGPVPLNCPFVSGVDYDVHFVSGQYVLSGDLNTRGGLKAEGPGQVTMGKVVYLGHLIASYGISTNANGQVDESMTVNFQGTSNSGGLTAHYNSHVTGNANGTPTSSVDHVNLACS